MDKKERLLELNKRLEEIKPIVSKSFKTSEELKKYRDENILIYNEAKEIYDEVKQLEWELMTPEERYKKEEQRRLSKLKREGKL